MERLRYAHIKGHVVKRNRNNTDKTVAELVADARETLIYAQHVNPDPMHPDLALHVYDMLGELLDQVQDYRGALLSIANS